MKKILITGFDPFGKQKINPSQELLTDFSNSNSNIKLYKEILPVSYKKSWEVLKKKIIKFSPDSIILFGQAGNRKKITPERIAINMMDSKIKDNDNQIFHNKKISEKGRNAYFSTLPVVELSKILKENGIPARISNSAGTFVCNYIMYKTLDYIEQENLNSTAGFIHLPFLPSQTLEKNSSFMCKSLMKKALKLILKSISD